MLAKRWFCALLILCGALLAGRESLADGLMRDGLGAISSGRGGTNIGFADNGAALYDNPGSLVNVAGNGLLDVDVDTVIPQVHYTDAKPNDVQAHVRPVPAPELAYIKRSRDKQWAWGAGLYSPAGFGAAYDFQNSFAGPQLYKSFDGMGRFVGGAAYRLTDRLSLGGTVGIALNYFNVQGPLFLQSGSLRGAPTIVDLQNLGFAPVGSFGVQYLLTSKTTVGLSYLTESKFHMGGSMDALAFGVAPFPLYSRFSATTDLVWPRTVGVGFAHRFNVRHTFAVDAIWTDWHNAFNQINVNLTNPSNPLVAAAVGPANVQHLPLNWRDVVSLRVGYQWSPDSLNTYRLGYVFHASPAPSATLTPYAAGLFENTFTAGYSRKINKVYLNAAYQFAFGPTRAVGVSSLAGGDFSNSTLHTQAHVACLGILVPL